MSKTKYITSGGLAFSEYEDMDKLRRYSLKGWHVSDFSFMGYTLEKGENKDYIYTIDYRSLHADEQDEYFDFFFNSGWSHVSSSADIHLFRARPGTKPIYTDPDTTITIIILLFVRGTGTTVKILTSMVIGGIVFPTVVWIVMTLYHKIRRKHEYTNI
ncbi:MULTISPECIES: DUF2812 domain-containing protein [Oceanobacillus]|uniref:DUF2812 domain-containing protein n=1 Tax=Oceanobacillus indicireducens TaxID=1004261 RepID=A0A918D026_9BACI|nr:MULTISPECIES: DUF2812 domain-containing protein [Oceanobacillus]GGN54278.1 hypothetical protein GCM10007971_11780 [Oceanobacillus indicireducens]